MDSSHLALLVAAAGTAIVAAAIAIVLRCVTKPCAEQRVHAVEVGDLQPVAVRKKAAKGKKKRGKRAEQPQQGQREERQEEPSVAVMEEIEEAAVAATAPQQLLLGVSGETAFEPAHFGSGERLVYGGDLGKDKEEEEDETQDRLPQLGNPQGYENVQSDASPLYGASLGSHEPAHGGAVSAYLNALGNAAVVYEDGDALASSAHQRASRLQATAASAAPASAAATPLSSIVRVGQLIDWNAMFQETLDLPETNEAQVLHKYERLSSLAHDFVETAQRIGTLIISEAHLPVSAKTLLPVNIGGEAGGEKWLSMGILFKFAVDWKHFYGGDARAMKSAGHELKSLMRYYQCEGIRVPLMALIDYRGYRLVAQSVLPISHDTLVYGSCNSGKTVCNSSPQFSEKMRRAGEKLNIKVWVLFILNQSPSHVPSPIGSSVRSESRCAADNAVGPDRH